MSQKENQQKVDPCFLAWVYVLEILEKEEKGKKEK